MISILLLFGVTDIKVLQEHRLCVPNIYYKLHIHQDFIEHPETMSGLILTKNITVYQKVQILNMLLREK